jgi:hypothetical protein
MIPEGIFRWERELSFIGRAEMTAQLAKALHATLPHEQIAPKRFARATSAVGASPLLAVSSNLVEAVRKEGARVHTVGVDRVSADFYYFAEGGAGESLRVQGNLIEMLGDRLGAAATDADIEAQEVLLINRLLSGLSKGLFSELEVELADALPRLSRDGSGLAGTDLEAFEAEATALAQESARFEASGRRLAEALATATKKGQARTRVPLYGEAERETMAPLEVLVMGKPLLLPECFVWTVSGVPREERVESPPKPSPKPIEAPAPAPAPAPPAAAKTEAEPAPPVPTETAPTEVSVAAPSPAPASATVTASAPSSRAAASKAPIATNAKPSTAAARRSSFVPILLLLGLMASLFFLWRSLSLKASRTREDR